MPPRAAHHDLDCLQALNRQVIAIGRADRGQQEVQLPGAQRAQWLSPHREAERNGRAGRLVEKSADGFGEPGRAAAQAGTDPQVTDAARADLRDLAQDVLASNAQPVDVLQEGCAGVRQFDSL